MDKLLQVISNESELLLKFTGELTVYQLQKVEEDVIKIDFPQYKHIHFDLNDLTYFDSAAALFFDKVFQKIEEKKIVYTVTLENETLQSTLNLVKSKRTNRNENKTKPRATRLEKFGKRVYSHYSGLVGYIQFLGEVFIAFFLVFKSPHKIRYKEIFFEMNEAGIKAIGIITITSFLIGLVVAYQSAYQLKIYGANIFIVDMLGLSILRELAPMITAIVIAGRSGSAYTAQIGAMKITQEIDAMKTMGFEPFAFLVLPRIIALSLIMPLLIFLADMMGMFGGIIIANLDLKITTDMFIDRFHEVIAAKHFFVGIVKGPFFAFLIASIAIYRGMIVKDDTQSIGFNTTKSVVESIFAVIVCDAVFSIAFTNLGI